MEHYKLEGTYLPNGVPVWISDEFLYSGEKVRQVHAPLSNTSIILTPEEVHEDIFIKGLRD